MKPTALVALATLLAFGAPALAEEFGGYRGPNHNGIYPAENLLDKWPRGGPKLLWKVEGLGEAWGPPVVAGDTVYVLGGSHPGKLHAFTLDGKKKWTREYGPDFAARFDGSRSTATVAGGLVVFNSGKKDERSTYALDAETGETIWHVDGNKRFGGKSQGWGWNASPLVWKDKVIVDLRTKDDECPPLVALDLETGNTVWTHDPSPGDLSAGDTSPQFAIKGDERIVVHTAWRTVLGVDPESGKRLWRIKCSKGSILSPVYNDGYLLVGQDGHGGATMYRLRNFDAEPEKLWRRGINGISQAVIVDGKVVALGKPPKGNNPKKRRGLHWLCLDAETGEEILVEPCMDQGSIIAADGMVYILEGGEHHKKTPKLSLIRPTKKGFEKVSSFDLPATNCEVWANPSIHAGRLFYRCGGMVAVYDLRAESYE